MDNYDQSPSECDQSAYWDGIATEWLHEPSGAIWRAYSDAVNSTLFEAWTDAARLRRVLKTDLFDEVAGAGVVAALAARSDMVFGVDISLVAASAARDRNAGLHAFVADVRALPIAEDVFDMIFSNSTLDHLNSRKEIASSLSELHRVLRDSGQLLLTLDNLSNPLVALRNALPLGWLLRCDIVPYRIGPALGPRQLEELLARADFAVQRVGAIMHLPRLPCVVLSRILCRFIAARARGRLARLMVAPERLATLPTRFLTGYFVAVRARKSGTDKTNR